MQMRTVIGLVVFGILFGGLSFFGFIGTPSSHLNPEEIQNLQAVIPKPIRQSMKVSQAYRAIPHEQVTFRANKSSLPKSEAEYLETLFRLVDLAVVERVQGLVHIHENKVSRIRLDNFDQIVKRIADLSVPPGLEPLHHHVLVSILEEKAYFHGQLEESVMSSLQHWHPLIQKSHRRLVASFQFLQARYPQESVHNQNAFFQHLCALDFI